MPAADLCSLDEVMEWVGSRTPNDEQLLRRLITQASMLICNYTNRTGFLPTQVSDVISGIGTSSVFLRSWPVISVSSLSVDGLPIAATALGGFFDFNGYILESWEGAPPGAPQALLMRGAYGFTRGVQNISVSYVAGYQITGELATVPLADPYQVKVHAPWGAWGSDRGVTRTNGAVLTKVVGVPDIGQYATAAPGVYVFSSADAGSSMLISYGYVPADIGQACIELVGERYRYKDRIGQTSKSLGGQETTSFSLVAMSDYVKAILRNYVNVVPF